MIEINFQNIEQVFFLDKKVQELLPEFRQQFDSWRLAQMAAGLRPLAQKSIFDVLNNITDEQIQRLVRHFGQHVYINKLNEKLVDHYNFDVGNYDDLCKYTDYRDFCITMNKDQVSITFWR
jgi:hypothetical protein